LTASVLLAACGQSTLPSQTPTPATPSPTVVPTASPSPSPTPEPTPVPLNQALVNKRFTILLVGEDVNAARRKRGYIGDNTDSIMVVSVSPQQKDVVMLSLPRDTAEIPMADGRLWTGKVNGLANTYGVDALRRAVATLLDIRIPYYVKVNMDDFVDLVDAVGGITVRAKTLVREDRWGIYMIPGRQYHLDGRTALYFSRARYFDNDYARAARQQQVVRALARKYTDPDTNVSIARLLPMLAGLETNLPMDDLRTLIVLAKRAARADYVAQVLAPPQFSLSTGDNHDGRGWVIIPNVEAMRAQARLLLGD
jgi:LCP family protein required for cell wall assembly